jgi:hypothetical protein
MPLFATFGWVDSYVDGIVERQLNEWLVVTYADNRFLHKIPDERIQQKRAELKRDAEAKIYFWRAWWKEDDEKEEK